MVREDMDHVLLVEDSHSVAASLTRALARYAPVRRATCIREGLAELRVPERRWLAAIVDIGLPDGSGLDLARRLVGDPHRMPTLVITGAEERHLANDAHASGAHFVFKPVRLADVEAFMDRVYGAQPTARVAAALEKYAADANLSVREREIVQLAIDGVARGELSAHLDRSGSTVKTQIRSLLNKTGAADLPAVVREVLEAAMKR